MAGADSAPFARSGFPFGSFSDGPGGFPRRPRARHGNVRAAARILFAEGPGNVSSLRAKVKSGE
jgi:hypothetical protein